MVQEQEKGHELSKNQDKERFAIPRKYETKFYKDNTALRALVQHKMSKQGHLAQKMYCLPIMDIKSRYKDTAFL